jgi:ribonuclease P/MRP protein subunit RPP40
MVKRSLTRGIVVEIELRLPSMLHGKKGFDRIVYAFKNVLNTPVTWLFCDLGLTGKASLSVFKFMLTIPLQALKPGPLDLHFPTKLKVSPEISSDIKVNEPSLKPPTRTIPQYEGDFEDFAVEIHEWLSLISLNSPRIAPDDTIDPVLSRYVAPGDLTKSIKLVKITWRGFIAPSWVHKTFSQLLFASPNNSWFAFVVCGFGEGYSGRSKDCTILKLPDSPKEYMLWEIE